LSVRIWIVFVIVASLGACQAESPAGARAECASDATCALSMWTADCCPRCKPFSATSSEVAAMEEKCHAMPPISGRCPELQCPAHEGPDYIAKCTSGQCVVGP
jgi:hypothetical protein